jgi:hypothetical protein
MPRIVKRSANQAVKVSPKRRGAALPLFIPPQLSRPVEKPPSGPQWLHEIKLDGYRMAARLDQGRAQLLTRTGLNWTAKYPSVIAALAKLNMKTAYLDGDSAESMKLDCRPSLIPRPPPTASETFGSSITLSISRISMARMSLRSLSSSARRSRSLWSQASSGFSSTGTKPATANSF